MQDPLQVADPPPPSSDEDERPRKPRSRRSAQRAIQESESEADTADVATSRRNNPPPRNKRSAHRVLHDSSSEAHADDPTNTQLGHGQRPNRQSPTKSHALDKSDSKAHADESAPSRDQGHFADTPDPLVGEGDEGAHRDSNVVCPCADDEEYGDLVECEECSTYQHLECVGLSLEQVQVMSYLCPFCNPDGFDEVIAKPKARKPRDVSSDSHESMPPQPSSPPVPRKGRLRKGRKEDLHSDSQSESASSEPAVSRKKAPKAKAKSAASTAKTKPSTQRKAVSKVKAERQELMGSDDAIDADGKADFLPLALQPLDEVAAEGSRATGNVSRWNSMIGPDGFGIKHIKVIRPNKMKGRVDFIRDLLRCPAVDGRRFRAIGCTPPDKNKGGLYSFMVRDEGHNAEPDRRLRLSFTGTKLCADKDAALAFAAHLCKYLDRFPAPPALVCVKATGAGGRATQMANMLEIAAIADFFNDVDWLSLIYKQKQGVVPTFPVVNIDKPPNDQARAFAQVISDTGPENTPAFYQLNVSHTIDRIDMNTVIVPPQNQFLGLWPSLPTVQDLKKTAKEKKLKVQQLDKYVQAAKAVRNVQIDMHGVYGTRQDLFKLKDSLLLRYTLLDLRTGGNNFFQYRTRTGPYNHEKVVTFHANASTRLFCLEASNFVKKNVQGQLPIINIKSASKTQVAFVLEALMSCYYRTGDVVQAWRHACAVADQISSNLVSSEQIKLQFCQCAEAERGHVVHVCQTCLANEICSNMERNSWDGLACKTCVSDSGKTDEFGKPGDKLRWQLVQLLRRDKSIETADVEQLSDKLYERLESFLAPDNKLVDYWTSTLREEHTPSGRTGRVAPLAVSIDAILPISEDKAKQVAYHANPDNLCLTADYLNRLKRLFPPRLLGLLRLQRDIESDQKAPDGLAEAYDNLIDQFDHTYVTTCNYSFVDKKRRLKMSLSKARDHISGMKRAEATQSEAELLFRETDIPYTNAKPWSAGEITVIDKLIAQCESRFDSQVIRSNSGAPWLWIKQHMPPSWSWDRLWRMFAGKFQRMKLLCNRKHETIDNITTLFLEGVYQHLKFRGRDEFLNLPMTIYSKHSLCLSIGHKHHGQQMRTGFTTLLPTDLDQHYDESLNNICFETQISNYAKFDYSESEYDKIRQDMRSIHLRTKYYDVPHDCARFDFDKIHRRQKSTSSLDDFNESDWDESDNEWLEDGFENE